MPVENEFFEISHVEWRYQNSKVIHSDRNPRQPIRVGIKSISVRCKKCGVEWNANHGSDRGRYRQAIGFTHITCPDCDAESVFPNVLLEKM
jgi:hypothetical protein